SISTLKRNDEDRYQHLNKT
ncbi:unnamed protein product, partial [Adineta steineri]